jgi:hypothetical protein
MYKLLLLASFAILQLSCNQHVSADQFELRQVFNDILAAESMKGRYYLIDSIENFNIKSITQSDTVYTIASCYNINNGVWTNGLFDRLQIISRDGMHSISKADPLTLTPIHYSFSLPYFSNDKKSFIIYYNFYCGSLCAEYSLRLYKKMNGKWIFIKSYYSVVS